MATTIYQYTGAGQIAGNTGFERRHFYPGAMIAGQYVEGCFVDTGQGYEEITKPAPDLAKVIKASWTPAVKATHKAELEARYAASLEPEPEVDPVDKLKAFLSSNPDVAELLK